MHGTRFDALETVSAMSTDFVPENELERQLMKTQAGEISLPAFIELLIASRVIALFDDDLDKTAKQASPLVTPSSVGVPSLAVFTSLNRATRWTTIQSGFPFALLVEFEWLLRGVAPDVGLVLNPGSLIGFEMPPTGVAKMRCSMPLQKPN